MATRAVVRVALLSAPSWPVQQRQGVVGQGPHLDVSRWHPTLGVALDHGTLVSPGVARLIEPY